MCEIKGDKIMSQYRKDWIFKNVKKLIPLSLGVAFTISILNYILFSNLNMFYFLLGFILAYLISTGSGLLRLYIKEER